MTGDASCVAPALPNPDPATPYTRRRSICDHSPRAKHFMKNGKLTHDNEHGHIWTTKCLKCGTEQKIRLGNIPLTEARQAVARECPGGYHVEIGGWRYYWNVVEAHPVPISIT